MFAYLNGTVQARTDGFAVIDVGGVGFKVFVADASKFIIGSVTTVHTYMHIREDIMALYGFLSQNELSMFELLIAINGVGPKAALAILSVMNVDELQKAIALGDAKAIGRAPGIGPKIAQRLILELKDKVGKGYISEDEPTPDSLGNWSEAENALVSLGYTAAEAQRAVKSAYKDGMGLEDTIKAALKAVMR